MTPCAEREKIDFMHRRLNGTENDPGTFADVKTILANQKKNTQWLIAIFCTCFLLMCGGVYWGITDHNKIQDMPMYLQANFIDKDDHSRSMALITEITNTLSKNGIKYEKSLEAMQKEIDRLYANYAPLRATRGGIVTGKKQEMTDEEFKKKLKEVDEKLFKD